MYIKNMIEKKTPSKELEFPGEIHEFF